MVQFVLVDIHDGLVNIDPGLPETRAECVEETQRFFIVCQGFSIIAQRFMNRTAIAQCPGIALPTGQVTKTGKCTFKVPQGIIVVTMPTTDFTQHSMHPCLAFGVTGLTEEDDGLLGMLTSLPIMPPLAKKLCNFVQPPALFIPLMLLTMQG